MLLLNKSYNIKKNAYLVIFVKKKNEVSGEDKFKVLMSQEWGVTL